MRMPRRPAPRYPAAMAPLADRPVARHGIDARRPSLARCTQRGPRMTLARCGDWAGLATTVAWADFAPRVLALFFLAATAVASPLGGALDRAFLAVPVAMLAGYALSCVDVVHENRHARAC